MKSVRSILCVILCFAMVLGVCTIFSSCNGGGSSFNASTREEKIEAEKSKTFQVLNSGVDRSDKTHPISIAMDRFEEQYGRKIDFVTCGYDEWNQKVMASLASGTPIDVVNAGNYEFPLYAMKKYAQPIDELVNLSSENIDKSVVEKFIYQGKHYVAASQGASIPLILYYNKTMFENEGVDDPVDLYKNDEWTYDKLKEIAMKFTKDTNGDGAYDQWGVTAWYQWVFFGGSAASVCKMNDNGQFELNMDNNPNLIEALELIQSAWYKDKWVGTEGGDIYTSFYQQKNAMLNEFTWAGTTILKAKEEGQFAFEVGAAPFPYGKSNTEKLNYCFMNGNAILNGCACPNSAGALIDLMMEENVKSAKVTEAETPADWLELYKDLQTRPFNSSMLDNAIDSGKDLCGKVGGGMDIQQALEMYKPVYKALVDEANKIPEDKVEHDFTTIDLDFTKGSQDGVVQASKTESLKVSNPGTFLKVEMDPYKYDTNCEAIKTDADKYPIWGYKAYKITFEYKLDAPAPSDVSVYKFELKRDGITGSTAVLTPDANAAADWVKGEVTVDGVNDNSALSLYVVGEYAGNISFKNLHIEEVKK